MHNVHTCLSSLEESTAWLSSQPHPLSPPGDETDPAWQRRLVEAALWCAKDEITRFVGAWGMEKPTMTPDMTDTEATVHLNVHNVPNTSNNSSSKVYVRPSLRARPLQNVVPNKKLSIEVALPASKLPLPAVLVDAFDNGVLGQAIQEQAQGAFWLPLNVELLDMMSQRFGGEAVWTKELMAGKLKEGWAHAPGKSASPRF